MFVYSRNNTHGWILSKLTFIAYKCFCPLFPNFVAKPLTILLRSQFEEDLPRVSRHVRKIRTNFSRKVRPFSSYLLGVSRHLELVGPRYIHYLHGILGASVYETEELYIAPGIGPRFSHTALHIVRAHRLLRGK